MVRWEVWLGDGWDQARRCRGQNHPPSVMKTNLNADGHRLEVICHMVYGWTSRGNRTGSDDSSLQTFEFVNYPRGGIERGIKFLFLVTKFL